MTLKEALDNVKNSNLKIVEILCPNPDPATGSPRTMNTLYQGDISNAYTNANVKPNLGKRVLWVSMALDDNILKPNYCRRDYWGIAIKA